MEKYGDTTTEIMSRSRCSQNAGGVFFGDN